LTKIGATAIDKHRDITAESSTHQPRRNLVHRLIKNRLFPALALAAALISPSAHAQAASGNDPIKLGLIDIYSGGFAFIADSIRTGFQIAVDEANAAGGLKGRPFQLVSADMGGQVEKAVTEGRRMILEDKIKFVTYLARQFVDRRNWQRDRRIHQGKARHQTHLNHCT